MISKAKVKYIRSLELKKNRKEERAFVAEGPKVVGDLLAVQPAKMIVATREWIATSAPVPPTTELIEVSEEELRRVSFLQHPQQVLAVFAQPTQATDLPTLASTSQDRLSLALDGVQDPGNLGTIIRIADWFGIETIFCSPDTADAYNPKVIQATMGSIARVSVIYADLQQLIDSMPEDTPVYGTLLDGENIYEKPLSTHGLIIMGNEGKGISDAIAERVTHRLRIPNFPAGRPTADSLNVAVATAITCSEFRRNESNSL